MLPNECALGFLLPIQTLAQLLQFFPGLPSQYAQGAREGIQYAVAAAAQREECLRAPLGELVLMKDSETQNGTVRKAISLPLDWRGSERRMSSCPVGWGGS